MKNNTKPTTELLQNEIDLVCGNSSQENCLISSLKLIGAFTIPPFVAVASVFIIRLLHSNSKEAKKL
jgi:hypothetical protein